MIMLNRIPRRMAVLGSAAVLTALGGGAAFAASGFGDPAETVRIPDGSCKPVAEAPAADKEAKGEPHRGAPCDLTPGSTVKLPKGTDVEHVPGKPVGENPQDTVEMPDGTEHVPGKPVEK